MLSERCLRFVILLNSRFELSTEQVSKSFEQQWGGRVACSESTEWRNLRRQARYYLLGDQIHGMLLEVSGLPLSPSLTKLAVDATPDLTESEEEALRSHRGYVRTEYTEGPDSAVDRATFAAQALVTLMRLDATVGYVNISAQAYRPKMWAKAFLCLCPMEPPLMHMLLTCAHLSDAAGLHRLHSHGMEQFGLPDLEVRFAEEHARGYYEELLADAALHMMAKKPGAVRPGHTLSFKGDSARYRIRAVETSAGHPVGHYGMLELVRE